jgi:hypothetical protein
MKQTAVQFLIEYMTENFYLTDQSLEQFDIAKEMEKEQIMQATEVGFRDGNLYANGEQWVFESPEQYYNYTYKK